MRERDNMKELLVAQFMKDVSACGLRFNNTHRVYHECLSILAEQGYPVIISTGEATKGEPILTTFQPKALIKMIDEAHGYALEYIRAQPDVKRKMSEQALRLEQDRRAAERYYEKHGTKGEF